jgi:hypothetical protein
VVETTVGLVDAGVTHLIAKIVLGTTALVLAFPLALVPEVLRRALFYALALVVEVLNRQLSHRTVLDAEPL